tara:strand:+ start:288 stop:527 length:240 start_codon:yes stop_codon:yes gene_type:complete
MKITKSKLKKLIKEEIEKLFEDNMEDMVADALAKMKEDGATDIDQYLTDNPELGYNTDMLKDQEFRRKLKMALKGEETL